MSLLRQPTEVIVLREQDAQCEACSEEVRRAIARKQKPPFYAAILPHAAAVMLKRETPAGVLLLSTACERSVVNMLLAFELIAAGAGTCGEELVPGVPCTRERHLGNENHQAQDGRVWR